ncbi:Calmodulin-like protein [Zostera marina]|uniref:Calmodulin-like protein n=1 Tax=Zostera marina TaxID=29655 RepID=A0A0K9NSS5_ZOSMR|nr:Calmodulin-like protein [Zostera marina]
MEYVQQIFQRFDLDGDEKISPVELHTMCTQSIAVADLSLEDVDELVASFDSDGDGLLGFEDFTKAVEEEEDNCRNEELKQAFGVYVEKDGSDHITAHSLMKALEVLLGEKRELEQCKDIICSFDLDGDGVISFHEFRHMIVR